MTTTPRLHNRSPILPLAERDRAFAAAFLEEKRLGARKLIGASCYNRLDLAIAAKAAGADYIAFGSCFDSSTKPAAVRASLALFAEARREVGLPMVAIGGITPENMHEVFAAGADSVAMISAIFGAHAGLTTRVAAIVENIGLSAG